MYSIEMVWYKQCLFESVGSSCLCKREMALSHGASIDKPYKEDMVAPPVK